MQLNKEYESDINLKDLLFHVLYRWRSILLVALIGAILLGGYKYYTMDKAVRSAVVYQDEQLTEKLQELDRQIEEKAKQVADLETYLNESVYINQSPQGIWTGSCKYLVKTETPILEADPTDRILPVYSYPLSGAAPEELMGIFRTDKPELLGELVETKINTAENSVTVSVTGATVEAVQKGLEYIQKRMDAISLKAQEFGSHTLVNVGSSIILTTEIHNYDEAQNDRRSVLSGTLSRYRSELQGLRDTAELYRTNGKTRFSKPELIKFTLIGFFLGAFLMICFYAFHYVLGGRLINSAEISEQYNLPVFGESSRSGSIHGDKGLDKLLAKWELGKNRIDPETTYDNICALIAEQQGANNILLVSTLKENKLNPVREKLATRMPEKEIKARCSFLTDSEAIAEAAQADAVLLVEEKGLSRVKHIRRMAESLSIGRANVIGAIVL